MPLAQLLAILVDEKSQVSKLGRRPTKGLVQIDVLWR